MVKIKQLKQHDEIFYPVTVGQAVIFEDDGTNADISEPMMDLIFDWSRNYISLTSTDETDNYIVLEDNETVGPPIVIDEPVVN